MATLDVTEKVNVLVDAIGWESFCEELMERMDETQRCIMVEIYLEP